MRGVFWQLVGGVACDPIATTESAHSYADRERMPQTYGLTNIYFRRASHCPYYVQRNQYCSTNPPTHLMLRLTRGLSLCARFRPPGCDHCSLWLPQTPFPARHLWPAPHTTLQGNVAILQHKHAKMTFCALISLHNGAKASLRKY